MAPPAAKLSSTGLKFAATVVGKSSSLEVKLSNTGSEVLSLSGTGKGFSITGSNYRSFSQKNNCGTSLAGGKSCTITVTFSPRKASPLSATLSIADNAAGSPQKIALSGTGKAAGAEVSLSTGSLTFAATSLGKVSARRVITLVSAGTLTVTFTRIGIVGANPASFTESNNCGTSLAPGKSCTISVTFKPAKAGKLSAAVSVGDNVGGSPQEIALAGTGV